MALLDFGASRASAILRYWDGNPTLYGGAQRGLRAYILLVATTKKINIGDKHVTEPVTISVPPSVSHNQADPFFNIRVNIFPTFCSHVPKSAAAVGRPDFQDTRNILYCANAFAGGMPSKARDSAARSAP